MIRIKNFIGQNKNLRIVEQKGIFTILEHIQDLSVDPHSAEYKFYMSKMNCRERQIFIQLNNNAVRLAPGAMQFMAGNVAMQTGVTGVTDLFSKAIKSKMTGDAAIKPLYQGSGFIMTETTYAFPIIENVAEWGGLVCDDGMFICCDDEIKDTVIARSNLSSAAFGGEGLFNLCLVGNGYAVLKSKCPRSELYEISLDNDTIKIDGNNAVCWSSSLQFSTERSSRSLIGSAASGEGLVNVYRGTGKILMSPLR